MGDSSQKILLSGVRRVGAVYKERDKEPMKKNRNKDIVKVIRQVWSSLDSHLDYSKKDSFDRRCVREYAELIFILSRYL